MSIERSTLIHAIETSLFLIPEMPGHIKRLQIPDVQGRITSVSHPFANLVGAAVLNARNVTTTVRQIYDLFSSRHKAFGWLIGPNSTPSDLASHLKDVGLVREREMAGMVLTDFDISIRINPCVRIREATVDDLVEASHTIARAFPMPDEWTRLFTQAYLLNRDKVDAHIYLAFLDEVREPVGYGWLVYLPNRPIVMLGGAVTQETYRGQGVYTSVVAHRLAEARAHDAEAAVTQAHRFTSAPICQRLGFAEICPLDLYALALALASTHFLRTGV